MTYSTYQILRSLKEQYYSYFAIKNKTMKLFAEMAVHNILNDFVKDIERGRFTGDELIAFAKLMKVIR